MIVTDLAVETLVPYARNPRNSTAAIDAVKASIAEFGFRQPIVVDEKLVVIVGHTRLEAAKQLGLKTVPVHVAEGLTPAQTKAYASTRVTSRTTWPSTRTAMTTTGRSSGSYRRQPSAGPLPATRHKARSGRMSSSGMTDWGRARPTGAAGSIPPSPAPSADWSFLP